MSEPTLPAWIGWIFLTVLAVVLFSWSHFASRLWNGHPVLPRRRQRRVPWSLDGAALASLFLFGAMISLFAGPAEVAEEPIAIGYIVVFAQLSTLLVFASIAVCWLLMRYQTPGITQADFGLADSEEQQVRDMGLGVLAFSVMLPMVYGANALLMAVFGAPTAHPAIKNLMTDPSTETIVSAVVLAVISAPLFEELAFRVLLQGGLQRLARRGEWWPIVVSSLAFGASHTNQGYAMVSITVLALGLGYVYRQTHSYPAVVAMHMAFNGLSLAMALALGEAGVKL